MNKNKNMQNNISLGRLRFSINRKRNDEVYKILEMHGVDVRYKDLGSALSIACMAENWDIATYCIKNGADVNVRDSEDATAIMDACKYGNFEVVQLLVEAGAELNVQNKYDMTPIGNAIAHHPENLELIEYLLIHGADPFVIENYKSDDPRRKTFTAYDYAKKDLKNETIVNLLDKYKHSESEE